MKVTYCFWLFPINFCCVFLKFHCEINIQGKLYLNLFLFLYISDIFLKISSWQYVRETSAQIFRWFQTTLNKNSKINSPLPSCQCWATLFWCWHTFLNWFALANIEKEERGEAGLNYWVFLRKLWLSHYILLMVVALNFINILKNADFGRKSFCMVHKTLNTLVLYPMAVN